MNSFEMQNIRSDLLSGKPLDICKSCYYEDQHNKVSGRRKQLLKSAIDVENFNKTLCASPHWEMFAYSNTHQGYTNQQPVDLQIDIGNSCNSACIMCKPLHSSRLGQDYKKLHTIEPILFDAPVKFQNWTDDDKLVEKFINEIEQISNLRYVHFLGGETLYLKSFYTICNRLIDRGLSKNIVIGTTTNATIYTPELEYIIKNFKQVHIGISIEAVTPLNDYIRWPSRVDQVLDNINKFINLKKHVNLQLSLRITPNVLSIFHISKLFDYMIENKITAESCNILHDPGCLRIELIPDDLKQEILNSIDQIINKHKLVELDTAIINRRREDLIDPVISSIIFEYKTFLQTYQPPNDIDTERKNLIKFIKAFETLRNNSILTYLPEYEKFLRTYGY
jgi:sulfatase maturation enzyme AslB (radical SAM superfamily)